MISSYRPLISICIPTYNQTKHLVKTLDSVFNQSFKDFELIISDDSTTSDVEKLVSLYMNHPTIKIIYLRNNPSLGSPENWNNAISLAKGEWIKIMHHDDWFCDTTALEKMVSVSKQNPSSLIFAGIKGEIPAENRSYVNLPTQNQISKIIINPFSLIWANIIGPPSSILFPKCNIKFDSNLIWLVDIEFYLQLLIIKKLDLIYIENVFFENQPDTHNITNQCFQNKKIEINEFNYIYNKYYPNSSFKDRLIFMSKLKKHINSYSKVNFVELFFYNYIKYK